MLRFDSKRFPDFENYLWTVHCQLVSKWVDKIKDAPDSTPLDEIPGAEELRTDVKRFEYFCRKFLGYEQYPKDHPQEYQFHYIGDSEKEDNKDV